MSRHQTQSGISSRKIIVISAILLLLVICVIVFCIHHCISIYKRILSRPTHGPRIIHLMYLPWDKKQQLKNDCHDFDHTYYKELCSGHPSWEIIMWTSDRLQKEFPHDYKKCLERCSRPTQIVDYFRWKVVYEYGGIYVQYESKLKIDPIALLPNEKFHVKLFTESILSKDQCQMAARLYPIRQGRPEEKIRVMNQIFSSAHPHEKSLGNLCDQLLERMKMPITSDYSVLYSLANAWISEWYDTQAKNNALIGLVDYKETQLCIKVSSRGSWRTDT